MSLCDYELQRLANIAENKQKLAALNLSGSGGAREKKVKRTGTKRSKVPDHAAPAEQKRFCARLRGVQSDGRPAFPRGAPSCLARGAAPR